MKLQYLIFSVFREGDGTCIFDARTSVLPASAPPLIDEVGAVLAWAHREFGAPSAVGDDGGWGFELTAVDEHRAPLEIAYEPGKAGISLQQPSGRMTLALTVTSSPALAASFKEALQGNVG